MINSSFVGYETLSSFNESLSLIEQRNRELKKIPNIGLVSRKSRVIIRRYHWIEKKKTLIDTGLNRHRFRGTRLFQSSNEFHCRIQNGFYVGVESIERTGPYRMKLGAPRSLNRRQSRCRKCRKKFHPFVHCSFDTDNWTSTTGMIVFVVQTSFLYSSNVVQIYNN